MSKYEELKSTLKDYDQNHLLRFWDELLESERNLLESDIREINFNEVKRFLKEIDERQAKQKILDTQLKPVPLDIYGSIDETNEAVLQKYELEGLKEIANGHVGVILMAGGQGTRLGGTAPKGMYDVKLPSGKSLFQIQAERIFKLQDIARARFNKECNITWYIMTSDATMDRTHNFFEENNYFGLNKNNVFMFEQGTLPCFDFKGKVLLDQKFRVAKSPDGNGGLYKALRDKRVLEDMDKRGIKYLHAYCVDNILVRVADPIFIGYCISKGSDCGAKVVKKETPDEALGVVCVVNGAYRVVEYSEIGKEASERVNEDGKLMFNAGSICNHFFTTEFLKRISNDVESKLEVHEARKKIPFVQNDGTRVVPTENSGIKIERFVFDVFPFAKKFVVWEVLRDEEFSPLKNGVGSTKDNPTTARQAIFRLHKKYITKAGGKVVGDVPCEISPLLSYCGEGLEDVCHGVVYEGPVYLCSPKEKPFIQNLNGDTKK